MTNIKNNNVNENLFSINEGLKINAHILEKNYSKWEYFFLDERGDRNCQKTFTDDESAYDYLWKQLLIEIKYPPSTPPPSLGI